MVVRPVDAEARVAAAKRPPLGVFARPESALADYGLTQDKRGRQGSGQAVGPRAEGSGPASRGLIRQLALGGGGLPPERDGHARLLRVAIDHEPDLLARLEAGDRVAELFDR